MFKLILYSIHLDFIVSNTVCSLFNIKISHVLTVADASEGLTRYYEQVRNEIVRLDSPKYRKSLDDITNEEVYDDLLADLETEDTIH